MNRSIILFLLLPFWSMAQSTDTLELIRTFEVKADRFTTDRLNHVYYTHRDHIVKMNKSGEVLYEQSNKLWGTPDILDASQPLRIMLYYADQMLLAILDNTLSVQGDPISFDDLGLIQATIVANSNNNNNLWVFDQGNFELRRYSRDFKLQFSSGNLSNTLGIELVPEFMMEYDNRLYLSNPGSGVLVFDALGTYIKQIPIKGVSRFQVWNSALWFLQDGALHKYDLVNFTEQSLPLPDGIRSFRLSEDTLYLLQDDGIGAYRLPF